MPRAELKLQAASLRSSRPSLRLWALLDRSTQLCFDRYTRAAASPPTVCFTPTVCVPHSSATHLPLLDLDGDVLRLAAAQVDRQVELRVRLVEVMPGSSGVKRSQQGSMRTVSSKPAHFGVVLAILRGVGKGKEERRSFAAMWSNNDAPRLWPLGCWTRQVALFRLTSTGKLHMRDILHDEGCF